VLVGGDDRGEAVDARDAARGCWRGEQPISPESRARRTGDHPRRRRHVRDKAAAAGKTGGRRGWGEAIDARDVACGCWRGEQVISPESRACRTGDHRRDVMCDLRDDRGGRGRRLRPAAASRKIGGTFPSARPRSARRSRRPRPAASAGGGLAQDWWHVPVGTPVNDRLAAAQTRDEVLEILQDIRNELRAGTFPF
jgi:hypothetical protein